MVIFVNNYFEFVKLKSHFKKANSPVAFISEYTERYKVKTKLKNFNSGVYQYILISERAHYFRICNVRRYEHLFFYSPPNNSPIFAELVGRLDGFVESGGVVPGQLKETEGKGNDKFDIGKLLNQKRMASVTTLFTKVNLLQMERIVGSAKAKDFYSANSKFSSFGI